MAGSAAAGGAIVAVALVFGPVLPGLYWVVAPSWSLSVWQSLLSDPQWLQALLATAVSTLLGSALALLLALTIAIQLYGGRGWQRMVRRLPLLLSLPHAAFAVGLSFMLAPSGWLARLIAQLLDWASPPDWVSVQDGYGLSLALALAIKESWFLLWVLIAVLGERDISRQMTIARTLGYGSAQVWRTILLPQLMPRLGWPLAAVLAYGLSVVDMAIILGPTTPPTLAVLIWRWLNDPDLLVQAQGSAAALMLLGLLLVVVIAGRQGWRRGLFRGRYPDGKRDVKGHRALPAIYRPLFAVGYGVVILLALWSVAGAWFFPALWPQALTLSGWLQADFSPFWTSLWLGAAACLICLPLALVWLEWGPRGYNGMLYLPLIVPSLPLAAAQYAALLRWNMDGTVWGLVWSHLLWVLPYMVLTLVGPYRAFDQRMMTTARALGRSRLSACLTVKWPMLTRPVLAALAVGFAVSITQYLPTLFAGGGQFVTVTTEAVALSAGGNRRVLAVQALLQVLLPLAAFAMAAWLPHRLSRHRKGLR